MFRGHGVIRPGIGLDGPVVAVRPAAHRVVRAEVPLAEVAHAVPGLDAGLDPGALVRGEPFLGRVSDVDVVQHSVAMGPFAGEKGSARG